MKKLLLLVLTIMLVIVSSVGLFACGGETESEGGTTEQDSEIYAVYNLYVANAEENGETPLSYDAWLKSIKGEKGDTGEQGIQGETGNGISSIEKTSTDGLVDTYTITYTDSTTTTFTVTNGKDGADGQQGIQGIQGIQGVKGTDGHTPVITIGENGNWYIDGVDTIKQATGLKGDKGDKGETGLSAYEIYKKYHPDYTRTEEEFIDDLVNDRLGEDENPQGLDFYLQDDGTYAVGVGNAKCLSSIVIPETYKSKAVTAIIEEGFKDCTKLKQIVIPNSVKDIGVNAFYNCSRLLYNEYDNGLYLGNSENMYLWLIKVSSKSITSCVVHDKCKFIYGNTFYECSSLTNVTIGNSITNIGNYSFANCSSLISMEIPNNVTSIGEYTFYKCSALANVTIGDSVESIGNCVFAKCSTLTSVVIGNSVVSIEENAFYNCISLSKVYYKGIASDWNNIAVGNNNEKLIKATRYYYSESEPQESGNYWHYDTDGTTILEW